jgi:hypothetical protein
LKFLYKALSQDFWKCGEAVDQITLLTTHFAATQRW